MKRIVVTSTLIVGVVAVGAGVAWQISSARNRPASAASRIERGKYLVNAIGCDDCHTPKKMGTAGPELDRSRQLSGHPESVSLPPAPQPAGPWIAAATWDLTAWSGPWGISYAANLTPDQNTGLGIWTEDMFVSALRKGRHMGVSRPILPPMPWQAFRNLSDEDLKSMFAYLRTLKPVHNRVPDPVVRDEAN
jgi:mono/diheme cytochrome c family protein